MNPVSHPLELRVRRPLRVIPQDEWVHWTSEARVLSEMASNSGMQDKTIAIEIGVDAAVLSKVKSGTARLSETDMDAYMDCCGSEAWLHFWLLKRGYDPRQLHRMESDLERENRTLREKLEKMEHERAIEMRLMREMRMAA